MAGRGIFASVANSSINNKSDFFKKGSGRAVVLEMLHKNSDQNGLVFVMRALILSSRKKDESVIPNSPGDVVGWPQLLEHPKMKKMAQQNVKTALLNITGTKESEVTEAQFVELWEDAINYEAGTISEYNQRKIEKVQDLRGFLFDFDTYDQQTKDQKAADAAAVAAGKTPPKQTNTYVNFAFVPDQGDIEARIKDLDKTHPVRGG